MREECRTCGRCAALSETQVFCRVHGWLNNSIKIPEHCEHRQPIEEIKNET